jgi:transposase
MNLLDVSLVKELSNYLRTVCSAVDCGKERRQARRCAMGRPRKVRPDWNALATIWTISDELWGVIASILAEVDPPKKTGRPRVDARRTLDAIIFRLRSGCQWNQLPERFPDDSSVHRTFQRWVRLGLFERIWSTLVTACEELGGVDWEWQAADGLMGKARLGGTSSAAIPPIGANVG